MTDTPHVAISALNLRDLPPGKHRYWLDIFPTPEGALRIPLLAVTGRQGPVVFAVAGVHGDEFEGPEAIWRVYATLRPDALRGIFAAIPICNPLAHATGLRTSPLHVDGLNLARVFPGDRTGSPTRRLAAALFDLVTRTLSGRDLFVDLHSGGTRYEFLPVIGYRRELGDVDRSAAAARAFGIRRLWAVEPNPGTFNTETARIGIPTVGGEVLGGGGSRPEDVAAYAEGLLNMLRFQLLDTVADAENVEVSDDEFGHEIVHRAQHAGMAPQQYYDQLVRSGTAPAVYGDVRRGKVLSSIMERITIKDAAGNEVSLDALRAANEAEHHNHEH